MNRRKHFLLFTKTNLVHLKRKWITLPLLFVFPIFIVGLIIFLIASFFFSEDDHTIPIGLINLDESNQSEMLVQFIAESSQLSEYINIEIMTEQRAKKSLTQNEISTYVVFPEHFITDLLQGNSITLPITGNPEKPLESLLVKEVIDSITRHIRSSQANILTINKYAKNLGISKTERDELIIEQFQAYIVSTLGSNQVMRERKVDHSASSNPIHYFGTSFFFIILSVWLLSFYTFLHSERHHTMRHRMQLYGVTELQQIMAKIVISHLSVLIFSSILITILQVVLDFQLSYTENMKLILLTIFYGGTLLFTLAILERLMPSHTIRLLAQCFVTLIGIVCSGAIIPTIYFPAWLQDILTYSYTHEAFHWMIEIIVHHRVYTNFLPLFFMMITTFITLTAISLWKERVK